MKKLVDGVARFHESEASAVRPLLAHLAANGQNPHAMMITCADSRLMPEGLTQADPGDLFTIRNIGNLVPRPEDAWNGSDTSVGAAVEFALDSLGVDNIIVMGHSGCGAMKALMSDAEAEGNIGSWLRNGRLALARHQAGQLDHEDCDDCDRLSRINVLASLDNLAHYLPVRKRLENGTLTLHGWWFDVPHAKVLAYDPKRERFVPVEEIYHGPALAGASAL